MSSAKSIPLNLKEFRAIAQLVEQRAGLAFDDASHYLFERRLGERVHARNLPSFVEYYELLRIDTAELEALFEALTTKETYFFRQDYQLDAFVREVLPELVTALGEYRRLTVWSAGCSTGEEAYTLAMLLSESPLLRSFNVQIVGTDLCQSNVEAARRAEYRSASFRALPPGRLERYFEKVGSSYRVTGSIRRMCHFARANLLDPAEVRSVGRVDVVFCRNVIIYFGDAARAQVIDALYERILPGGYLFLGHTESLLGARNPFEVVHLESDLAYRRPRSDRSSGTMEAAGRTEQRNNRGVKT
ncbi:MAG TPA: CheR family methyltransferase [Polyangiaceae bacterium]|nr:CheR family methyltransferase [Polyangiaceae bacterium]